MRWLVLLAILIAGAVAYLSWMLSDGVTAPREHVSQAVPEREVQPPSGSAAVAPRARPEARPSATTRREPVQISPPVRRPIEQPVAPIAEPPVDAGQEEVPWTDQQRQQQLWTANGRYNKGNYPGAVEAGLELARRYPDSLWEQDGWRVAIMGYCALGEPDKANELFGHMTDATAIETATTACTGWSVNLTKPPIK